MKSNYTKKIFVFLVSLVVISFMMNTLNHNEATKEHRVEKAAEPIPITKNPFIRSREDFRVLSCSFYLDYGNYLAYEKCSHHLRYLKDSFKEINETLITHRFPSCAVVGSSYDLLKANHGEEISSHDKIFRINEAPFKGYEKHVGNRTDLRMMHSAMFAEKIEKSQLRVISLHEGRTESFLRVTDHFNPTTDLIIHPNTLKELSNLIRPFKQDQWEINMISKMNEKLVPTDYCSPSSGLRAIYIALLICEKVTAYGYSLDYKPQEKWSYFRKETLKFCDGCWENKTQTVSHCYPEERQLQKKWTEQSKELFGSYFKMVVDNNS